MPTHAKHWRTAAVLAIFLGQTTTGFASTSFEDWSATQGVRKDTCVQFTYYNGTVSKTFPVNQEVSNIAFSVEVDNSITNRIGGGSMADNYSITMTGLLDGSQVFISSFANNQPHPMQIQSLQDAYSGSVSEIVVSISGIDNGFWAGHYGPIACNPNLTWNQVVSEPITTSPIVPEPIAWEYTVNENDYLTANAPEGMIFSGAVARYVAIDIECGIDVSDVVGAMFIGTSSATINANNDIFTDPCPGWYKKLIVNFTYQTQVITDSSESPTASPEPTPEVSPSPTPTIPPSVEPSPEPTPEPSPEPTPVEPEPTPTSEPEPSPTTTQEPTPTDTPEPEPTETPEPLPTPEPSPEEPEPSPTLDPEPTPTQTPEPTPSEEPEPTLPEFTDVSEIVQDLESVDPTTLTEAQVEQLTSVAEETLLTAEQGSVEYEQALEVLAIVAEADDATLSAAIAAIPFIGDAAGAVLEVFNDLGNIGADISPKVREQSEKVIIASVIVGQITQISSITSTSIRR